MGDQARDSRTTGMVSTQNLAQEDPERDQGRIDPVPPECLDRGHRLGDDLLRKDIGKR